MTQARVIGYQNAIPWHVPEDLQHFKRVTLGNPIIMGRKTFESIGKPLPKRHNIVISRSLVAPSGVTVVPSLKAALDYAASLAEHSFIIGGAAVYAAALPLADDLYISCIPGDYPGDRYFPAISPNVWELAEVVRYETFTFKRFIRKAPPA